MSIEDNSMITKACIMKFGDRAASIEDQVIFRSEISMHRKICENTTFFVTCEAFYLPLEKGDILLERKADLQEQHEALTSILENFGTSFELVEKRMYKLEGVLYRGMQSYMPIVFNMPNSSVLNTTTH